MSVNLKPRVSEKAIAMAERGVYVFDVPTATNKIEVTKAVEAQFKVKVTAVNILISKGKVKMSRRIKGKRNDIKKAMVTLKSGDKISLFEGAEGAK